MALPSDFPPPPKPPPSSVQIDEFAWRKWFDDLYVWLNKLRSVQ